MPIDINLLRKEKGGDPDAVRESQRKRGGGKKVELVDKVIALDEKWRNLNYNVEQLKKETGILSKQVKELKMAKKDADATSVMDKVKQIKVTIAESEIESKQCDKERNSLLSQIGNIVHHTVEDSMDEDDNIVVRSFGECRAPTKYHHHELLHMIDGYASEQGVTVAGHRAYFLKGVGVLLNQALINYGLAFLMKHQYTPLQPPFFMKQEIMAETAQLEEFDEALYKVTGEGENNEKYLIATSEQPISAFHRSKWLGPEQLPIRYAGYSTCFRKEAGSSGKDCWGIFRVHQFEKIEQFCITDPESSWDEHEKMITVAEEFYKSLGLSYRVVNIVSGELNNAAAKKYDLEAWFPTLSCFRELVSSSNCTDYQSRAMETRFDGPTSKAGTKEKQYVHMLNATLCATERTICCLLENYQTEEGVLVPEVLQPFMGGMKIMPFVNGELENKQKAKQEAAAAKKAKGGKALLGVGGAGQQKQKKALLGVGGAGQRQQGPAPAPKKEKALLGVGGAGQRQAGPIPATNPSSPDEVTAQANKVRALKEAKADPAEIKAAVELLLELKKKHGVEGAAAGASNKGGSSKKNKKALLGVGGAGQRQAGPAPAPPAAAGGEMPAEVQAAADKVRELKETKADPADIKAAVAILLELKKKHNILPPPKSKKSKK